MSLRAATYFITSIRAKVGTLQSSVTSVGYVYKQTRDPLMQTSVVFNQYVHFQSRIPLMKTSVVFIQYAITAPEEFVTDLIYPQLIGLSWDTVMKPNFSTKIAEHTSGKETRTQFWEDPRWDFSLNYDYLPNKEAGVTDLKRILGFFLQCAGSFETFLFKAPDFHTVVDQQLLVGDGNITEVDFIQDINGYTMPVGYIDSSTVVLRQSQTQNIVADGSAVAQLPFPYNATLTLVKQGVTTLTAVASAPTVNQYVFDSSTGELTLNVARAGQTIAVTYSAGLREGTEFTILYPRTIILDTATPTSGILSGSYEYYFTCRFPDNMDLAQFSDKLWNLQEIEFRSTIE